LIPKALTFWEGAKRQQVDETKRDSYRRRERMPHESGRKSKGGYHHSRGDRKSAEVIENRGDSWLLGHKRVRNLVIMLGLQGCDRRERAYVVY
jgi:hypothetical protein